MLNQKSLVESHYFHIYNAVKWMKGEILIKSKIGKKFTCQIVGFTEKVNSILANDFW